MEIDNNNNSNDSTSDNDIGNFNLLPVVETKKRRFFNLCEYMELKTSRQAKKALCEELDLSESTAEVYFHLFRKQKGLAKKRPRKKTSE